jgi:glycosyltransferase involved in cell wall biosynthesis
LKDALPISLKILKKKCQDLLAPSPLVVMTEGANLLWPKNGPVDVVFMGSGINFISHRYFWLPNMRIRIWTLSVPHKNLLVQLLNLKESDVGVLPRYQFFPLHKNTLSFNNDFFNQEFTFVFSSRFGQEKNFLLVVQTVNMIQKTSKSNIRFVICGPGFSQESVNAIQKLIGEYTWKTHPEILEDLGPRWVKKIKGNPVLINLSTYLQEDFGVSVAQAQEAGWPVIVSDWGGHRDVVGVNVIKIPSKYVQQKKVKRIVHQILSHKAKTNFTQPPKFSKPSVLTYQQIEKKLELIPKKRLEFYQKLFSRHNPTAQMTSKKWYREVIRILSS